MTRELEHLLEMLEEMYDGCTPGDGCTGCEVLKWVQRVRESYLTHVRQPACDCRFAGSLADQVFTCLHCACAPEECADGECGCRS